MKHDHKKFAACQNCGYSFAGADNFCPDCGQQNHDMNLPFGHMVLEVLEGTFHFDTKIFRTLKLLLFKPGRLTEQFLQNKRAPYVPPIRLYIFCSFIFFLVLAADLNHKTEKQESEQSRSPEIALAENLSSTEIENQKGGAGIEIAGINREEVNKMPLATDAHLDSLLRRNILEPTAFKRAGLRKIGKFLALDSEAQSHKFFKILSLLMFLLMPLFALITKSAYFRNATNYVQYLIIALHYHCFVFLVLTAAFLLEAIFNQTGFVTVALVISVVYLLLELQYLFKQTFSRTLLKWIYIEGFYMAILCVFMLLTTILSIFLV